MRVICNLDCNGNDNGTGLYKIISCFYFSFICKQNQWGFQLQQSGRMTCMEIIWQQWTCLCLLGIGDRLYYFTSPEQQRCLSFSGIRALCRECYTPDHLIQQSTWLAQWKVWCFMSCSTPDSHRDWFAEIWWAHEPAELPSPLPTKRALCFCSFLHKKYVVVFLTV